MRLFSTFTVYIFFAVLLLNACAVDTVDYYTPDDYTPPNIHSAEIVAYSESISTCHKCHGRPKNAVTLPE